MTKRELAAVACKVLAIWILAMGIMHLANILAIFVPRIGLLVSDVLSFSIGQAILTVLTSAIMFLPSAALAVFALIVWKKADWLAGRMVGPEEGEPASCSINGDSLLTIGVLTIGIAMVASAIPDAVGTVWQWFMWKEEWPWPRNTAAVLRVSVKLTLGLWLILGTKRIVRTAGKVRNIGLAVDSTEHDQSQQHQKENDG